MLSVPGQLGGECRQQAGGRDRGDEQDAARAVAANDEVAAVGQLPGVRPGEDTKQPGPAKVDHGRCRLRCLALARHQRDASIAGLDLRGLAVAADVEGA